MTKRGRPVCWSQQEKQPQTGVSCTGVMVRYHKYVYIFYFYLFIHSFFLSFSYLFGVEDQAQGLALARQMLLAAVPFQFATFKSTLVWQTSRCPSIFP